MTNHQRKQVLRDQREKQIALYGYYLDGAPEYEKRTIRWGAVFLAVCLGGLLWFIVLTIIYCL